MEIIKILCLTNNMKSIKKCIVMPENNIHQEFRTKKITETRNYLITAINQNEITSKRHKSL